MVIKSKSNIVFLWVEVWLDISWYFIYVLSLVVNKS